MTGESGHFTGSVCLSRRSDRHGFLKNRHGYFTNPLICPRIGRIKLAVCPEKAAFGTVWREDISQNGLQPIMTNKVDILDHIPIRIFLGGHSEPKETEPKSGSDSPSRGLHRHGFPKNRHGYFTNPSICPRIGRMKPATCPEKAVFGTVWTEDNSQNGLQYAGTGRTGVLDRTRILSSTRGHGELREKKPFTGSVYHPGRPNRHGFPKNRHSYFTNPLICPRIAGMMPIACPKKAAFGTVWTGDSSENGLQYAGRKDTGDWGQIPIRMEREFRGPGYRAGRKNDEQDNPMENQV